jgi:hypothetical protein
MNRYICHYETDEGWKACIGNSLFDFKDGFWIDGEGKFLKLCGQSGKYWIPPSRISYIEKQVVEEGEGRQD